MLLVPATEAEKRARDAVTYEAWGSPLSLWQYQARELALRAHPFSAAAMQTWLWRDEATIFSSCETFRMAAMLGAEEGDAYAIASVFTEASLRGQGHATAMMNALVKTLQRSPRALACTLYSDVGLRQYEPSGFVGGPAVEWVMAPLTGEATDGVEVLEVLPAPRPAGGRDEGVLRVVPTVEQLDWHVERERLYAGFLAQAPLPFHCAHVDGARMWFAASFRGEELLVLWHEGDDALALSALMRCARRLCHQAGLQRVRAYDVGTDWSEHGTRQTRASELPMVRALQGSAIHAFAPVHRALWV